MSKNRGQSNSRSEKRLSKLGRNFSNKKGVQLLVNRFIDPKTGLVKFTKITKFLQRLEGKTLVQYQYS